jgi:hypothetical protein
MAKKENARSLQPRGANVEEYDLVILGAAQGEQSLPGPLQGRESVSR